MRSAERLPEPLWAAPAATELSTGGKTIEILREAGFNGVLSVECGTPERQEPLKSLEHLNSLLA